MNLQSVQKCDSFDMRKLLADFPRQIQDAVAIGEGSSANLEAKRIQNIVITGLGGSAIGGDLLRSYIAEEMNIPVAVNRHYFLPEYVGGRSLVIVSSYSGNTEETIDAYRDAIKRKANIICITSGGEISAMAKKYKHPLITIPPGLPPRAAIGYSFFPLLMTLIRLKMLKARNSDIKETLAALRKKSKNYGMLNDHNKALWLAKQVYMKCPVIYSSADRFDIVNLRWRGQFAENAKSLAFGHVIPEMNHNELVGWKVLRRMMEEDLVVLILRDKKDHERVKIRMDITKSIVEQYASRVININSEGKSLLARMFSLIYLGDWTSFYLAVLNGIDPTPVKVIDYLKNELSKV